MHGLKERTNNPKTPNDCQHGDGANMGSKRGAKIGPKGSGNDPEVYGLVMIQYEPTWSLMDAFRTNARNFHELKVRGVDTAIVVASGPSLNKNVSELYKIQDDVFIVTALRSLPVLNEVGVRPDLVVQLDAEDDEV